MGGQFSTPIDTHGFLSVLIRRAGDEDKKNEREEYKAILGTGDDLSVADEIEKLARRVRESLDGA